MHQPEHLIDTKKNNPFSPKAEVSSFDRLYEKSGPFVASMYLKGKVYREMSRDFGHDKRTAFENIKEYNIHKAMETESDGRNPVGHGYLDECLKELNGVSASDLSEIRDYLFNRLQDEEGREEIGIYFDFLENCIKEGDMPFFSQVSSYMKSELDSEKDIECVRRVTVKAFSRMLFPLLEAKSALETEKRTDAFKKKVLEVREFLKNAFPDLSDSDSMKKAEGLNFLIISVLEKPPHHWEATQGYYIDGVVVISYNQRDNALTLAHEILHGLSGGNLVEETRLTKDASKMLTEALVEEIVQMSEQGSEGVYLEERKKLAELRRLYADQGLEMTLSDLAPVLFGGKALKEALKEKGLDEGQIDRFYETANEFKKIRN